MKKIAFAILFFSILGFSDSYMYLFAKQDAEGSLSSTHTWATFVDTSKENYNPFTISWSNKEEAFRLMQVGPQKGRNRSLPESFDRAVNANLEVHLWGPYAMNEEFYQKAQEQYKKLEQKKYWYRIYDDSTRLLSFFDRSAHPFPMAVNCIHAVSDIIVDARGFLWTGTQAGYEVTEKIASHFSPYYTQKNLDSQTRSRVERALGIDNYKMKSMPFKSIKNSYCKTLEECRKLASF